MRWYLDLWHVCNVWPSDIRAASLKSSLREETTFTSKCLKPGGKYGLLMTGDWGCEHGSSFETLFRPPRIYSVVIVIFDWFQDTKNRFGRIWRTFTQHDIITSKLLSLQNLWIFVFILATKTLIHYFDYNTVHREHEKRMSDKFGHGYQTVSAKKK